MTVFAPRLAVTQRLATFAMVNLGNNGGRFNAKGNEVWEG